MIITFLFSVLPTFLGMTMTQSPNVDGRWLAVQAELAGQAFPDGVTKTFLLIIRDGDYEMQNDHGTVKLLDDGRMEVSGAVGPNAGKTYKAIYKLKQDELMICYDLSGKDFPEAFATQPDTKLFLVKYTLTK